MVVTHGHIAVTLFSLSPNDADWPHVERDIDRDALCYAAPDREALLSKDRSIAEIRQGLKLSDEDMRTGHWAEQNTQWHKNQVFRNSPLDGGSMIFVRRCNDKLSTPPVDSFCDPTDLFFTEDKQPVLISPTPLEPTHRLIAYRESAELQPVRTFASVELPINGLIFLLNVPNLTNVRNWNKHDLDAEPSSMATVRLPYRKGNELPAIAIPVPHLETLPEIVKYLHTKNEVTMFQELIPSWALEVLQTLPTQDMKTESSRNSPPPPSCYSTDTKVFKLGRIVPCLNVESCSDTIETKKKVRQSSPITLERNIQLVGAAALQVYSRPDRAQPIYLLTEISVTLNRLKDNLTCIGYAERHLWDIIKDYSTIIREAILHQKP